MGENLNQRVKQEYDEENVTLKVQKEGTPHFYFTMKRTDPMINLMKRYCERRGIVDMRSIRFSVDGERIRGHKTPNHFDLQNEDIIDASSDQERNDEEVTLKVTMEGKEDFYHTIKRSDPLRDLMIAYCGSQELGDYRCFRFLVDGDRVQGHQTPNELDLKNSDVIDVFSESIGG